MNWKILTAANVAILLGLALLSGPTAPHADEIVIEEPLACRHEHTLDRIFDFGRDREARVKYISRQIATGECAFPWRKGTKVQIDGTGRGKRCIAPRGFDVPCQWTSSEAIR